MNIQAVEVAEKIEGWMSRAELEWLSEMASKSNLVIEIGSWQGRSTKAIAASTEGKVYAVDAWRAGIVNCSWAYDPEVQRIGWNGVYDRFCRNLSDEITSGKCIPVRMASLEASVHLKEVLGGERKADMVFIDGDHDWSYVKQDIEAWRVHVRKGGRLCGHDHSLPMSPGVVNAVDTVFPNRKIVADTIWCAEL